MKLHYALVIAGPMIAVACGSTADLRLGGEDDGGSSCPPSCDGTRDGASGDGSPDSVHDSGGDATPVVCVPSATGADGGNSTCVMELASGGSLSCALEKNGTVWCWGSNAAGGLGIGTNTPLSATPVQVLTTAGGAPFTAQSMDVGDSYACAIKNSSPWCWGLNNQGQLGLGPTVSGNRDVPSQVVVAGGASLTGVSRVSTGGNHACALKGGEVWCWGSNSVGELGRATVGGSSDTPAPVTMSAAGPSLTGAAGVSAGSSHTCAWKTDGSVWCWGENGFGQLGSGTASSSVPVQVSVAGAPFTGATQVTTGQYHACARKGDGSLWCWGGNNRGQLGTGLAGGATPSIVLGGKGCNAIVVSDVRARGNVTCATMSDQSPWCWGGNDFGELGTGDAISYEYPARVSALDNVIAIAPGGSHTCTARGDGTTWCWGRGEQGELGDGTTPNSPVRSPVTTTLTCP